MLRSSLVVAAIVLLAVVDIVEPLPSLRPQAVAARGFIMCNGRPVAGAKIRLTDHDTFTSSNTLSQSVSGPDGSFYVAGTKSELTGLAPELRVYHKCGHTFFERCTKITVPKNYIASGTTPQAVYDAGVMKLESMREGCNVVGKIIGG